MTKAFLDEVPVDEDDVAEGKDNRDIRADIEQAQKLTAEEIKSLKEST
jgi:hypothetical protein